MTEKKFDARLQLKCDTYDRWEESDLVLKYGEAAVAFIPLDTGAVQGEPAVIVKIGDGEKTFSQLPIIAARATDVYSWAKEKTPPKAEEIPGIGDYIAKYIGDQTGVSVDTDTQYRINKVDAKTYTLQSRGKGDSTWVDVENSTIIIPDSEDCAKKNDLEELENKVDALIGEDENKTIRTIASEELTNLLIPENAKDALDTLAEIAAWIQSHPEDAAKFNKDISELQERLQAIEDKKQTWDDAEQNAKTYTDNAIANLDVSDEEIAHNVVTSVSETDGKIAVTKRQLNLGDIDTTGYTLIIDCGNSEVQ